MNKHQIHRMALLAVAKLTFFAAAPGCQGQSSGRGRAISANAGAAERANPRPHPVTNVQLPSVVAGSTTQASPAQVAGTPSATCTTAPPANVDRVAACDAALTAATRGLGPQQDFNALWECCSEPGMHEKHAFCSPWGPPAPPAMPRGWA
jgi:hypothetical protein